MSASQAAKQKKVAADEVPGHEYGNSRDANSLIKSQECEPLDRGASFSEEDEELLRAACEVLANQRKALVAKWRAIVAADLHLEPYSPPDDSSNNEPGLA